MDNQNKNHENNREGSHESEYKKEETQDQEQEEEITIDDDDEVKGGGLGRKILITIIVIALLVIGAYYLTDSSGSSDNDSDQATEEEVDENNTDNENSEADSNASILVGDQSGGSTVFIDSVTFTSPSWIAVEDNLDGERGNTLGALWLPAGTHTNQAVELLRSTIDGNEYYVVLREDSTNDHIFSRQDDPEIKDASGDIIITTFKATSE